MRILVTNDDGIRAEGIARLARMAKELGEVWVVAPKEQCSAMSQRITVHADLMVRRETFPVEGVHAYSVDGTPADCVKVALMYLLPEKPDVVFSGINFGYNIGFDIAYSGTVGAAMEAIMQGVPAMAFSNESNGNYEVAEAHMLAVTKDLLEREIAANEIWNINFPGCGLAKYRGILEVEQAAQSQFYLDHYEREDYTDGSFRLSAAGIPVTEGAEGTDMYAVLDGYISVGKIRNLVMEET
ncbi:MAG: 5'/3'-nucleotidase SurE [Clostridiales bacterium]|nr:5'/3'-nucleotidase SurE [Roseburia sp.]MDD7636539.1 5'/3'-nucleotidase SurE [Clostridiales bacterium]MDY4114193.1 5'/3'-nucleotidase SurE [Roseburia sp.]